MERLSENQKELIAHSIFTNVLLFGHNIFKCGKKQNHFTVKMTQFGVREKREEKKNRISLRSHFTKFIRRECVYLSLFVRKISHFIRIGSLVQPPSSLWKRILFKEKSSFVFMQLVSFSTGFRIPQRESRKSLGLLLKREGVGEKKKIKTIQ